MPTDEITSKRCSRCGSVKPATPEFFNKDKHRKDGLKPSCSVCSAVMRQESRQRNRSEYLAKRRAYESMKRRGITGVISAFRCRLWKQLCGNPKPKTTMALVGCSVVDLRRHIESLFLPGMTWSNRSLWHVDHIRPCVSFDISNAEQLSACFHFTNLRPLWAHDNMVKHSKWTQ